MKLNVIILMGVVCMGTLPSAVMAQQDAFHKFIPNGFNLIENHCQADFNKDGKKDCVLLIKDTQKIAWQANTSGQLVDRNRRGVVILFKTRSGYQKVLENKSLFSSENEEGGVYFAPELEIVAKNHKLEFYYGHGRYGSWGYIFDYRTFNGRRDFYLIGYDGQHQSGPYVNYTQSVNFLTHRYRHQDNIDQTQESDVPTFQTTWHDLPKTSLIRLADIDDLDGLGAKLNQQLYDIRHADESNADE